MPERNVYEVVEWNPSRFLKAPSRIRFRHKADMEKALADIMNDKDIEVRVTSDGSSSVHLVPFSAVKQDIYEGKIALEAEED